jgi:hypothetical protein
MVITKEETFGPVAPLYCFKTDAEAIKMANDTPTLTLPRSRGREGTGSPRISTAATASLGMSVRVVLVPAGEGREGAVDFYSRDIRRHLRYSRAISS